VKVKRRDGFFHIQSAMMILNDQIGKRVGMVQGCHSERSEESPSWLVRFFAALRMTWLILSVEVHNRSATHVRCSPAEK
jgi:hypothetical protein